MPGGNAARSHTVSLSYDRAETTVHRDAGAARACRPRGRIHQLPDPPVEPGFKSFKPF
jgi:hypothetical protein